ncbi:MAG: PAS domain-containing sensor histidine kinase [Verrucomicrobiota bacterium]
MTRRDQMLSRTRHRRGYGNPASFPLLACIHSAVLAEVSSTASAAPGFPSFALGFPSPGWPWAVVFFATIIMLGLIWFCMNKRMSKQIEFIRRRESALEARYQDLFENGNDIIYTLDLKGRFISLNHTGENILGYSREEVRRLSFRDMVADAYRDLLDQQLQLHREGQATRAFELEVVGRGGRRVVLDISSRLNYENGQLTGIQGIARDITERKRAEEALRRSEQQLRELLLMRERIGRDLHDGIIQSIYAVGLNLEDCRRVVRETSPAVEQRLAGVLRDLNVVIRDVRNFILGLKPEILKGQELQDALKSVIQALGEKNADRFVLHVDAKSAEQLDSREANQLLHIAREAISNSLRHSKAEHTVVSLQLRDGCLRFEVQDDGIGFSTRAVGEQGFGLRNMAARARELGANFQVISQIGEGTRILLEIPRQKSHETTRH